MKHTFLLDENILYFAVKGVDARDNPDLTATQLLYLIAKNCHKTVADKVLIQRYWGHFNALSNVPRPIMPALFFITQFVKNCSKLNVEYSAEPPQIASNIQIPNEDVHIVRAALMFGAVVITADEQLRTAINSALELKLRALNLSEAIKLAREVSPPDLPTRKVRI